jgi:hypothetical protein
VVGGFLVIGYAAMLSGVLAKNRVGVACYELEWVCSDKGRAADAHINGIREEPFTKTRNDEIIGKGGDGQVIYSFGPLVMDSGLSLHGS